MFCTKVFFYSEVFKMISNFMYISLQYFRRVLGINLRNQMKTYSFCNLNVNNFFGIFRYLKIKIWTSSK